ncbi:MAG TPA: hypothetical protein ENN84_00885 [Candidatus Marinimicrobia bacterium]|nr:hypothetical protein [Candidatus Neomarinimicrobiota bacterium]
MKTITVHWTEIRRYEFPDDAPVHDEDALCDWVDMHPEAKGNWDHFAVSYDSDTWDIVDISETEAGNG